MSIHDQRKGATMRYVLVLFTFFWFTHAAVASCELPSGVTEYEGVFLLPEYRELNGHLSQSQRPILVRGTEQYRFSTLITESSGCPVQFAGHYNVAVWGSGTESKTGFILDRQTGFSYRLPPASWRYMFHPESRLLLVDPLLIKDIGKYIPSYIESKVYEWLEGEKSWREVTELFRQREIEAEIEGDNAEYEQTKRK